MDIDTQKLRAILGDDFLVIFKQGKTYKTLGNCKPNKVPEFLRMIADGIENISRGESHTFIVENYDPNKPTQT